MTIAFALLIGGMAGPFIYQALIDSFVRKEI